MVRAVIGALALTGISAAPPRLPPDLEDRLVRESNRIFSGDSTRAVHADPTRPGRFGDSLVAHLPPLNAEFTRWIEDRDRAAARDVWLGRQPWARAPASWAAAVDRLGPQLDGLLAGSHAARAELPPRGDITEAADGVPWMGLQVAAELTALRVRRSLALGATARATDDCLDGLALGRDASITGLMIGRMLGIAAQSKLIHSCVAAFDALPAAAKRDAIRAARAVRDAVPPMSTTVRDDVFSMSLWTMGRSLSASAKRKLLPAARRAADASAGTGLSAMRPEQVRAYWAFMDRVAPVLDRPVAEREAALRTLDEAAPVQALPQGDSLTASYSGYARHADAAMLRLDALVLAAVADLHALRGEAVGIRNFQEAGLITPDEARRLAGARLRPTDEGALEVSVALGLPDREETLALRVTPDR
jgi:hypothetical protein